MSMEEYEIECLRNEAEMEDEESRKDSQIVNEAWIDALELALERVRTGHDLWDFAMTDFTRYVQVRDVLNGIRNQAAMLLPKDHEQYMDQQGDEPNKNKGEKIRDE